MDTDDVVDLLTIVAVGDRRTVGEADVVLWQKILGRLDLDSCTDAVMAFRAEQPGVWLEPGHIMARVKAKTRDRLDRMDPDSRPREVRTAAPEGGMVRWDRYGFIDKAAPDDEEFPPEWTPEQRSSASWARIDELRDQREYEQAVSRPGSLLTKPPATDAIRARALAQFAAHQGSLDGGEVLIDESVPHVNALKVPCSFCKAAAGSPCTMSGMSSGRYSKEGKSHATDGLDRNKLSGFHPARVQKAAHALGYDQALTDAIVAIECGKHATRARARWKPGDGPSEPIQPAQEASGQHGDAALSETQPAGV